MVRTQNLSKFEIFSPSKLSIVRRNLFIHIITVSRCLKITQKVSFYNITSEAGYVHIKIKDFWREKSNIWKISFNQIWVLRVLTMIFKHHEIRRMKEENVIWKKCTSSSSSKLSFWSLVNRTKTFSSAACWLFHCPLSSPRSSCFLLQIVSRDRICCDIGDNGFCYVIKNALLPVYFL